MTSLIERLTGRLIDRLPAAVRETLRRLAHRPGAKQPADPVPLADHPETESYAGGSGPVAVLLCHGFTSTPQSLRDWALQLEQAGYAVSVPRLPGHGTTWQELNATPWTAWYAEVDAAFRRLRDAHRTVFVAGLSMGAALALRLAQQHGDDVAGLVLVNPCINIVDVRLRALPVLKRLTPSLGAVRGDIAKPGAVELAYDRNPLWAMHSQTQLWADVRAHLAEVRQPLLVYRSETDHIVDDSSMRILRAGVGSTDQTWVALTRSYHVATLDYEADQIAAGSIAFVRRLTGGEPGPAA